MSTCIACGAKAHPDGWFRTFDPTWNTVAEIWACNDHRRSVIVESGHPSTPPGFGRVIVGGNYVAAMRLV